MDVKALETADEHLVHRSEIADGFVSKQLLIVKVVKVA